MTDYLVQMKSLANSLKAAREQISSLVDFITEGLGNEYNNFLHNLHFQDNLSFDKIFGILIQEEYLLKRINPVAVIHV